MGLFLFLTGCTTPLDQSGLLKLTHVDEEIVDVSGQEIENIYDPLNLLKRGEAYGVKGDHQAASEEYKRFVTLYPFHRLAPFAQYSLGLSYSHKITTIDRDLTPITEAISAFNAVITRYPESLYAPKAAEKIKALTQQHAEHEFLIGHFYFKKKAYPAAIARFERAVAKAGDSALTEKTLYYLGQSHVRNGNIEKARPLFQDLRTRYPHSTYLLQNDILP
jgi:outer membrane protein assembly factor BamD